MSVKKILWNNNNKKNILRNGAALNYSCIRAEYKRRCDAVLFDVDCSSRIPSIKYFKVYLISIVILYYNSSFITVNTRDGHELFSSN